MMLYDTLHNLEFSDWLFPWVSTSVLYFHHIHLFSSQHIWLHGYQHIRQPAHPKQGVMPSPKVSLKKIASSSYGYKCSTHLSNSCQIWLVSCQSNPLEISIWDNMYFSNVWHASKNAISVWLKTPSYKSIVSKSFKTNGVSVDFTTTLAIALWSVNVV